jgi:hypothetical protein
MRALLVGLAVLLSGCPEKKAPIDESDPLIRKLKAEQERLNKGGQPGGPPGAAPAEPPNQLAELAQQPPDMPVNVPVASAPASNGVVSLTPKRLETAQIIAGPKLKLTTADRFARLVVTAAATKDVSFDLAKAVLTNGADTWELARDVQRVGQGSPLAPSLGAGVPQDLVLYFEVPVTALKGGLRLKLPTDGAPIELPLIP